MTHSKKPNLPIWQLGSKYTRVSILQNFLPKVHHSDRSDRRAKYLKVGNLKYCEPFPVDKFSARRLPALPELCEIYFKRPKQVTRGSATESNGSAQSATLRLPSVKHKRKQRKTKVKPEVGGGTISYEDEWTFAKLTGSNHASTLKTTAPFLKHYWNISGQDRQRIISCPQHNLIMNGAPDSDKTKKCWRVPACISRTHTHTDKKPRHVRTAEQIPKPEPLNLLELNPGMLLSRSNTIA